MAKQPRRREEIYRLDLGGPGQATLIAPHCRQASSRLEPLILAPLGTVHARYRVRQI
jgi:hypothetical protein